MKFEVYCDESMPDLFTSKHAKHPFLMIGSLWLEAGLRGELKQKIKEIRQKHHAWGEIKWSKVSNSKIFFYEELIDLFMSYGSSVRFRCIAIEHQRVDWALHNNSAELGFYKFYYQLLHHWIMDFNDYKIFCDTKTNGDPKRLNKLTECLKHANLSSEVDKLQALPSRELVLMQMADLLLGVASSRLNGTLKKDGAKEKIVKHLEERLGRELCPTAPYEQKFNIFKIRLDGGW